MDLKRTLKQSSIEEAFALQKIFKIQSIDEATLSSDHPTDSSASQIISDRGTSSFVAETMQNQAIPETGDSPDVSSKDFNNERQQLVSSCMLNSTHGSVCTSNAPLCMGEALLLLKSSSVDLPPLSCKPDHRIFFKCLENDCDPRIPYPSSYTDLWSEDYVRMPCSPESLYPLVENGQKSLIARWSLIQKKLREPIHSSEQLQDAILSYNERFKSFWSFNVLHDVINNFLPDGTTSSFFKETLPSLCNLALNLPVNLTRPIPLMRKGEEHSFSFSQLQIASLLANAFFCTFPRRNSRGRNAEFARYPFINFSRLFSGPSNTHARYSSKREKVRCILHYFHRVTHTMPSGTITYTRRRLGNRVPDWANSTRSFDELRIHINAECKIEDAGMNTLQVDFANRFLGGGVLSYGCVQEEIMFVLRPELLAAGLFIECLDDDEAVIIEGAETYSRSSGYSDTFKWVGDYNEAQEGSVRDEWGRWKTAIVAIDATHFRSTAAQFSPAMITRELNKAYCGFTDDLAPGRKLPSVVATGNWGCGAFRGNLHLKALLQMMACLQAGKSLAYFTFQDTNLMCQINDMHHFLSSNAVTVGNLWKVLMTISDPVKEKPNEFFEYIKNKLTALTA